ncbi:Cof-type HAD-IIB family hydrolase [Brevibacillus parabrevis]|uniref:Stress response protein YhaX n=1 Tax=Brevibacillus parabrevis TaxID=54914 RepID=A0A4Y3PGU2_BREPA|nr:Cof-type HAD-IIB family hydrolase [Brevibacillus parabrevis]GEB33710.1 stress response protein YhaX [Brevibacillus parabrevis]
MEQAERKNESTRYKLLALDVDGTILMSNHSMAKVTQQAISGLADRGVFVTLATGRAYPSAKALARQLNISTPLVSHDGAYVADPLTDEELHVSRIPVETTASVTNILAKYELDVMLLHEAYTLTNRRWKWKDLYPLVNTRTLRQLWRERYPVKLMTSADLIGHVQEHAVRVPKIFVMGEESEIAVARKELETTDLPEIRVTTSGARNLEILPEGISKASGLALLAKRLEISPEQIVAVGDNYNDLEMLQFVGMGVAMGNAPDEVKRLARHVTDTNDQHGVAAVIQKFFGIHDAEKEV